MREVIMTVGLQASGKSTWAKQWVREAPNRKRLNRDDLRLMLDAGQWSPENEKLIVSLRNDMLISALRAGNDVVIDDTNLRASNFADVCELLRDHGIEATVREQCFPIDFTIAVNRDTERGILGKPYVGTEVIRKTWERYGLAGGLRAARECVVTTPATETLERISSLFPDVVLCDLDGTLAKMGDRSPYDASRCDELDSPNAPVVGCVRSAWDSGYGVIFVSAREEKDREPTLRFICHATGLREPMLLMRATGDKRKDSVVKRELFDKHIRGKYNVLFVLDDRNQVVREWRAMGLTCFQVAPGDF